MMMMILMILMMLACGGADWCSDPCRARPVVDIIKKITITPPELDLTKKNCGNKIWWVQVSMATALLQHNVYTVNGIQRLQLD